MLGTDAGIYETFDLAENWRYHKNLPLTQYYKVAVNDANPSITSLGEHKTMVLLVDLLQQTKERGLAINTGIKPFLPMDTNLPLIQSTMISSMPKRNKEACTV